MILSTNIDPNTNTRPSIVTKENIDFLFDVQNIVDTMSGTGHAPTEHRGADEL